MSQTIFAKNVTLETLSETFGLNQSDDQSNFQEWQSGLPTISEFEQQALDRIKSNFKNLNRDRSLSEEVVKMVVLSPLLDLTGFYQPPFKIVTEPSIELLEEDEGTLVKGNIDVLVILKQLWVLVIESKQSDFSLNKGIPQALAYMLAEPTDRPTFGLITNGSDFIFLKVSRQPSPQYILSKVFSLLNPGNDLIDVLRVLKHLAELIQHL